MKIVILTKVKIRCLLDLFNICTLKNTNDYVIQLDPEEHSEYRLISSLDEMSDEKVVPFLIDILSNKNL